MERFIRPSNRGVSVRFVAVGDQIEGFEDDLAEQPFAQGGPTTQSMLMERLPIWTITGPASGRSFRRTWRITGTPLLQAEAFHHVLRQNQRDGSRIDDGVDGRTADVGFLTVSPVDDGAVAGVFECDIGANLSHGSLPVFVSADNDSTDRRSGQMLTAGPEPLDAETMKSRRLPSRFHGSL